ncbi:hypothetical protein DYB32_003217, partial [Aphanomyces invadans]
PCAPQFQRYLERAKAKKVFPPDWTSDDDRKLMEVAGQHIHFAVEKHDVMEKYGNLEPMVVRLLAEHILGQVGTWLTVVTLRNGPFHDRVAETCAVMKVAAQTGVAVRDPQLRRSTLLDKSISFFVEVKWALVIGRPLFVLCLLQHALSFMYFAVRGVLMASMTPYEVVLLQAWNPLLSSIVSFAVAGLHVLPYVRLCHHCAGRTKPKRAASVASSLVILYASATHFLEVVCETFMAEQMAEKLAHTNIAYGYALCVTINCWFTPWLFFLPASGLLRMLVDFVDCLLSFVLSTGIPLFYHVVPMLQAKFGSKVYGNSFDWLATNIPVARFLVVNSPVDLIASIGPNLSNFLILWRIVGDLQRTTMPRRHVQHYDIVMRTPAYPRGPDVSDFTKKPAAITPLTATTPLPSSPVHSWPSRLCLMQPTIVKVMLVVNFLWGAVVLVFSTVSTFGRDVCPPFCVRMTAPWDHLGCNCLYVRLNCPTLKSGSAFNRSMASVDGFLDKSMVGTSVLLLLVKSCAIPNGISADTMAQFPRLFAFRIQNTSLRNWDIPSAAFNESVLMIQIFQSDLRHVPRALHHPHSRSGMYIADAPDLGTIPPDVWTRWQDLSTLWLANCNLQTFPEEILTMPYLITLGMEFNTIRTIPAGIADMPALYSLHVVGNQLRALPSQLLRKPSVTIYADGNPIETVDLTDSRVVEALASQRLLLSSTPFCDTLQASPSLASSLNVSVVCPKNCEDMCTQFNLGNSVCNSECFTESCGYDSGDCSLPFN